MNAMDNLLGFGAKTIEVSEILAKNQFFALTQLLNMLLTYTFNHCPKTRLIRVVRRPEGLHSKK
jgi:hypothetical protein